MTGRTARRRVLRVRIPAGPGEDTRADLLAVEEPLEIRVDGEPLTVTMRTPGDDIDLAAGFLFTEGLLTRLGDMRESRMCDENVAAVTVADDGLLKARVNGVNGGQSAARKFLTTSACGVCGK